MDNIIQGSDEGDTVDKDLVNEYISNIESSTQENNTQDIDNKTNNTVITKQKPDISSDNKINPEKSIKQINQNKEKERNRRIKDEIKT